MITDSERANASQDTPFLTADGNVPEHFSSATLPMPILPTDALALTAIKRTK